MKPAGSTLQTSRIAFAVLLLIHLLFFCRVLIHPPVPLSDSKDYLNASYNLYSQGVLYCGDLSQPIRDEQFTRRPPLYPLMLGKLNPDGSQLPVLLIQILISMTSILLASRMFFRSRAEETVKKPAILFATILLIATPAQYIYSSLIMAEILFQLILVLMAWCAFQFFQTHKSSYLWLFNLFLTLGMATKPVLYPFALLTLLISLFLFLRSRRTTWIMALILPLLWMVFYSIWNYNRTGSAQYSSIQTANLVNYNFRYFLMEQEGMEVAGRKVDSLYSFCSTEAGYREKNKCLEQGVRRAVLEQPLKYGLFHLKGSARFFLDPGRFDLVNFFSARQSNTPGFLYQLNQDGWKSVVKNLGDQGGILVAILGMIAFFKGLKLIGFILFLIRGKQELPFRIFLALLVGYLALATGPLGASRFLLPVELLIIACAVLGWSSLKLQNFKHFRKVG